MRGLVAGLPSPHPLGLSLPAIYQEDAFAQRFVAAFDDELAPIFSILDNLVAYLDPHLAPEDFLEWLAGWVGAELDENWPLERRRAFVARSVELYRSRGTARGLSEHVEIFTGTAPEVEESGGVAWSTEPNTPMPGVPEQRLMVRLRVPDPAQIDSRRLEALVAAAAPAHLETQVEVAAE